MKLFLTSTVPDKRLNILRSKMSLYNDDELIPPSWIDKVFFETVLQQCENYKNVKVNSLEISPASVKGDHYASIMFRCKLNYNVDGSLEPIQKSLVLKTLPDDGVKAELMQQTKVFETEISMYTKTLPKIEQILGDCGEPTKLAAEIVYHSLQPRKVIIFEDLCVSGYDALRSRYLTEDELHMTYRKLAKFHAASVALSQSEDSECVTKYEEGLFTSSAILSMDIMSGGIPNLLNILARHEEFKVYYDKIKALQPEIFAFCKSLYNSYKLNESRKEIFVLNHGDFHLKNLMFKFNSESQAVDLLMVDYQISCYGPLNIDMIYSQYMIMQPEFRLRRNEFMQYYFTEFIRVLKKTTYRGELPCYSDFQIANLKYRHFSVFMLASFLPFNHFVQGATEKELKELDVSEIVENYQVASLYNNPSYIEELRQFLPILLNDGYLD